LRGDPVGLGLERLKGLERGRMRSAPWKQNMSPVVSSIGTSSKASARSRVMAFGVMAVVVTGASCLLQKMVIYSTLSGDGDGRFAATRQS
jgi:hypothetical protein